MIVSMPDPLSERTSVKLSISSWYHVLVIVGVIVGIYFSLRQDVANAIAQGAQNAQDIQAANKTIMEMRLDVQRANDNLLYFRQQYEQDMKRYIRDAPIR